ncbi:MAG: MCP four helix bundle domain-containing protein, partial [Burkholderiaceae bacterium]
MPSDPQTKPSESLSDASNASRRSSDAATMNAQNGMLQSVRETLGNLSVRTSLALAFACVVAGAVVIGVFSLFQMGRLNESTRVIYDQEYTAGQAAEQVRSNVLRASRAQTQLLTSSTKAERDALGNDIASSLADAEKKIAVIQSLPASADAVATTKELVEALAQWTKRLDKYVALVKTQPLAYMELVPDVELENAVLLNQTRKLEKIVDTLVAQRSQSALATLQHTGEIYKASVIWVIGIILLLVTLSIAVGSLVT